MAGEIAIWWNATPLVRWLTTGAVYALLVLTLLVVGLNVYLKIRGA